MQPTMTEEEAKEFKTNVLDIIKDFIPDRAITPLWSKYREIKQLRPDTICPCTCEGGKTWNPIVTTVRDYINDIIVKEEDIQFGIGFDMYDEDIFKEEEEPIVKKAGRPKKIIS